MMYVRPCVLDDLEALENLAYDSPIGLTSLPENTEKLREQLDKSCRSFAAAVQSPGDEEYLFALVDSSRNCLVGVSGIIAKSGLREPYFNFRREQHFIYSQSLQKSNAMRRLVLSTDNSGKSVFSSFFIGTEYRTPANVNLLARARVLYVAGFPQRFCDEIIVEFVGITDERSESPFWNAVGRAFFSMEYDQAEHYCGMLSKSFIGELTPPFPIYESLLPASAQAVIGQHDADDKDLLAVALSEGFYPTSFVDVFDGGPCFSSRREHLKSLSQRMAVDATSQLLDNAVGLLANGLSEDFRCVPWHGQAEADRLACWALLTGAQAATAETQPKHYFAPLEFGL